MLRSEPAQIPILLRSLHEQRSPEREGLAVTVTPCLTGGSIISAAQWNALLAAGLHRVYMDIILTDEIYHDVRTRKYLSMVTFGLGAILTNLTNKDEDSIVDHRNPIVADEVIDKTVELWDFIWARRNILQEGVESNLYQYLLGQLILRWSTTMHLREHTSMFTQTRIGHVAFYIWQYTKRPDPDDDATLSLLTLSLSSSRSDKDRLVQEAVVDTFGHHLFVDQLNRDLQDQTFTGIKLYQLMRFLAIFATHPATKRLALERGTYKLIFPAIRRQRGESEEVLWKTIRWAVEPLVWAFKECNREVLIELVEQHGMMKLMSRAMILGAKHAVDPEDLVDWSYLSKLYLQRTKTEEMRAHGDHHLSTILMNAIRRVWYRTLVDLRAITLPVKNQSAHQRAISDWEEFGYYLGFQESMFSGNVSAIATASSDQAASSATPSTTALHCSWARCEFHDKEPPHALQMCSGCGKARYCNRTCQASDWKQGGHKRVCKPSEN